MLTPAVKKNDRKASVLILTFSVIVFAAVVLLSRVKLEADLGFDVHFFALIKCTDQFLCGRIIDTCPGSGKKKKI